MRARDASREGPSPAGRSRARATTTSRRRTRRSRSFRSRGRRRVCALERIPDEAFKPTTTPKRRGAGPDGRVRSGRDRVLVSSYRIAKSSNVRDPTPAFRSSRYARSLSRGGGGVVRTSCRPWSVHRRPVSHVSRLTRFASARPGVASSLSRLTSTAPAAPAAATAAGFASALLRAATHRRYRSWLHLSTRT